MMSEPDSPVDIPQDDGGEPTPDVDPEDTLELDDIPGADDDDDGAGQESDDGSPVG